MELRAVRGMHDLFGDEMRLWGHVEAKVRQVFATFGYEEIRTPVLEKKEVFSEAVGDETDIVEKQMYTVNGDGDEKMVLRPEGTAAFIRAVVEHQLHRTGHPLRYYYYLPMFRHERPQKGRLRQFFQFGAELINDPSPEADAEIIALLDQIYKTFGVTEYVVKVNSVGCSNCRPAYKEKLKDYFRPHLPELCPQCVKRFDRSVMRILDCKNEACHRLAVKAPKILDNLCEVCQGHHAKFKSRLKQGGIAFEEDPQIVRGLDYYTRTAFEFTSSLLGAQSALCGGGRYDGLSARFGEKPFPAVGFGLGMERLMMVVEEKLKLTLKPEVPLVYLAPLGEAAWDLIYPISLALRRQGVWVGINHDREKSLKSQLKEANRLGCRFAVLVGEDEIKAGQALLKDMREGTQSQIPLKDIENEILQRR